IKMPLLIQHGCEVALEVLLADMEAQTKDELNKKAHSAVILCLGNKVLREVTGETTPAGVWSKLETLYMTKSLANKLYLKKKLYTFYIYLDLWTGSFDFGGRDDHTKSKEIKERSKAKGDDGEGLYVRGRTDRALEKQRLFGKKSLGKIDFCENCVLGKSHRVGFGVGRHTTQGVMDYVHSDLWGPSQVESLGSKRYFLSIVDDYSRRVWVYILRFKHEAFGKFKEWKQLVENQTRRTVKKLRTDNGLEFCNREFEQLCIESGIARHLTVVGTPQQNGVAERMNRTLMDKVRCLLIQSGLPKTWIVQDLLGRSDICVAYPHDKQGKLDLRAVKCVLLGYPEGVKGYRLYRLDDESPKIVTRRNVVFNESVMYKDTLKNSGADQEDGDDEDAGDQETDQPSDLTDYQLVRDREPMTRVEIKERIEGVQKPRYKVRLVARGFTQRACNDYNEVFSPVVRHTSIRVILALTACKDYELEQLDVKTAFLHGNLEEVIYMRQPPRYEQGNKIACKSKAEIGSTKSLLKMEFDMQELGEAKKILGMEIVGDRSRKILMVSQSGYVYKILNNFRIDNGKSVKMSLGGHFKLSLKDCPVKDCDVERMSKVPYANAVGSLMYLMVCTRPNIAYAVSVDGRYLANPGFVSDYAKNSDKSRSITGYAFLVQGCVVSWKATLQHVVSLSTIEAKYMALTEAVKEAIWLRGLLKELGVELNTVAVNCDNQGAIHLSRNHVLNERTKHINVPMYASASMVESVRKAQHQNAAELLSRAFQICKQTKIKAETLILEGDPKEMLCQAVEQMHVDLLVVGSRGLSAIKR
nr:hypothetical protein [Tanacetum cinerariifolium]